MLSQTLCSVATLAAILFHTSLALNIVIPGGTGPLGKLVASKLSSHSVTILSRNSILASTPSRVTEDWGWVGRNYLDRHPHVTIRDWDGGDLLDIVGCDWMGWQDDALKPANVVINLVGGYTQQRVMATERIVRESLRVNPNALQITVAPTEEDLTILTPGLFSLKAKRLKDCEDMVKNNCRNAVCLRLEANELDKSCQTILDVIASSNVVSE